jgi:predicted ATPase
LEAAATVVGDYRDGVFVVALAPLREAALVVPAIAHTLGLPDVGIQPAIDRLKDYLRSRRLLLVLDNFEHVVQAAPQIADLLFSYPGLSILATSRAALRVRGEFAASKKSWFRHSHFQTLAH